MSKYVTTIIDEGEDNFLMHAVIEAASYSKVDKAFFEDYAKRGDKNNLEIELTVNGFSLNVKHFFEQLEMQHNRMLKEEAKKLIIEQCGELRDTIDEIKREMLRVAEQKLGIKIDYANDDF